ncbi:MAG: hypothetical protein Q8N18_12765 [Opitutaceae bacterium]|nr:hypothetical protein [Opitutaceae bacterium]
MKIELLLSRAALVGVIALIGAIVLGIFVLELFAAWVATVVLLTVVSDYQPRLRHAPVPVTRRRTERMPLAV